MKKKVFAILLIVALVTSLSLGLAACNKDEPEQTAKASNAETLGTTVAVFANSAAAGGSGAAAAESEPEQTGLNLTFNGSVNATVQATVEGIAENLEESIQNTINYVDSFVAENSVKVETLASTDADFIAESDYTLKVTVSYLENNETPKQVEYFVAIDTNGADIEGTKAFDFTIKAYYEDEDGEKVEVTGLSISGTATYNSDIDGLKFGFEANVMGLATVDVNAYATKEGTIGIDLNAGAGALGVGATAGIKVELGKLAENKYGAEITVNVSGTVPALGTFSATVNVAVVAEKVEDVHQLGISGAIEVKVTPELGSSIYVVKGDIAGDAEYVAEDDNFAIAISGALNVTTEAKPE